MTLKGTIGTSLMNLFKPIMVVVNNAIVVINQFAKAVGDSLGKILGWRYEVGSGAVEMSDMADYADDTASGLGKAGKAAQDLKRQLQGFDELNNLTSNDDNGGGGGSGGGVGGLGGGSAGDMAGKWVKERGVRSEMIVTSKGGEDHRVPGALAMHREDLLEDVDESLMRAGFDYFDFYLFHSLTEGNINEYAKLVGGAIYTKMPSGDWLLSSVPSAMKVEKFEVAPGTTRIEFYAGNENPHVKRIVLPEGLG